MAKKKAAGTSRFGTKTQGELAAYVDRARDFAAKLDGVRNEMAKAKIDMIGIDGVTKADRGHLLLMEFFDAAEIAVRQMKRRKEVGDVD